MEVNSYTGLLETLKNQNTGIDWETTFLLAENTLEGSFFHGKQITTEDYYMVVNADGTLNYMQHGEDQYLPLFTATVLHEDKVVTVFGFNKY